MVLPRWHIAWYVSSPVPSAVTTRWTDQFTSLRRIGFDSNALIYHLEGREPYAGYVAEAFVTVETFLRRLSGH